MLEFSRKTYIMKHDKICWKKELEFLKVRRSERLVDMTQYLLDHPHELISLTSFAERYESAKSSISEDLGIIKNI